MYRIPLSRIDPTKLMNVGCSVKEGCMKEFKCAKGDCGSRVFMMVERKYTVVDFSREGAIKGHPFIGNDGSRFDSFACYVCGEVVPSEQGKDMYKEVL